MTTRMFLRALAIATLAGCAADVGPDTSDHSSGLIGATEDETVHEATGTFLVPAVVVGGPPDEYFPGCAGVLIRPGVLLTVATCMPPPFIPAPPHLFRVSFAAEQATTTGLIQVQGWELHPEYAGYSGANDVAVVYLDPADTEGLPFVDLPPEGHVDVLTRSGQLSKNPLVAVAYGSTDGGFFADGTRRRAEFEYAGVNENHVLLAQNSPGAVTHGDTGGPVYRAPGRSAGHGVLVGIVGGTFRDSPTAWVQRLDTPEVAGWLAGIE